MMLAAFEPGIFFLFLWGLISWLTRKKKKKIITDSGEVINKPKKDIFSRLQKLQEHLSSEVDIFPFTDQAEDTEEEYYIKDDEYFIEDPEISKIEPDDLSGNKEFSFTKDIKIPTKEQDNWLKQALFRKAEIKKLMVLKEVLGEPRSLKPYTGEY